MLNPNPEARCTLQDVFVHPWMAELNKPTTPNKKRRTGISYKSSDTIRNMLMKLNECECSCHADDVAKHGRDSVITRHCDDCSDVQANDPKVMMRRQVLMSRNSSVSSGYGSEMGSQYLGPPLLNDQQNMLGFEISKGRCSVPRKSSASSVSTLRGKASNQRCSMPAPNILREYDDEEDIVFV